MASITNNKELRILRFNDNPFSGEGASAQYEAYLKRIFRQLERVNGNQV
jgi:hypothetical protein